MNQERIEAEMHMLEKEIGYKFNKLSWLEGAMKSAKLPKQNGDGKNHREYSNEALAFLGDTVIKFSIAHHLYLSKKRKGEMSKLKSALEANTVFHEVAVEHRVLEYAYNDDYFTKDDPPQDKKVCAKQHDPYIEAIAAAIFLDGGWTKVSDWFKEWLLPKLEQHKSL